MCIRDRIRTITEIVKADNITKCTIQSNNGTKFPNTIQLNKKFTFKDDFLVVSKVNKKGIESLTYYNIYHLDSFYISGETIIMLF